MKKNYRVKWHILNQYGDPEGTLKVEADSPTEAVEEAMEDIKARFHYPQSVYNQDLRLSCTEIPLVAED